MPTSPLALLDIDSLIGEEERAMQKTVRQFVDERIRPDVAEWYETGKVPVRDLARELGGIGALGHAPRGLRLHRDERHGVRPGLPGGRGR